MFHNLNCGLPLQSPSHDFLIFTNPRQQQPPPLPLLAPLRTELARPCCLGASPPAQTSSAGVQGRELCAPASDGTAETAVRPRRTSGGRQAPTTTTRPAAPVIKAEGQRACAAACVASSCWRAAGTRGVCGDSSTAAAHGDQGRGPGRARRCVCRFVVLACCRYARGPRRQQHDGGAR